MQSPSDVITPTHPITTGSIVQIDALVTPDGTIVARHIQQVAADDGPAADQCPVPALLQLDPGNPGAQPQNPGANPQDTGGAPQNNAGDQGKGDGKPKGDGGKDKDKDKGKGPKN